VRGDGTAFRYPVAVGRPGKQWFGEARIDGKYVEPAWAPPEEVKRDNPRLPVVIPGSARSNPMGARALTLDRDEYAIHGTNRPDSIGTFASYGCIRMRNADIIDLFDAVKVGTRVVVTR
jgi:lipoprotein-anchoring transpeptidase ErfK/SrfK